MVGAVARPAKILVVDDSPVQLDRLVQLLERHGYAVATATDGREALRKVVSDPPDLVLLDRVLPDMDGLEVARFVKARPAEQFIPVIVLSVKADLDSKVKGLQIGASDYIAKPFADQEVLARCDAMLHIKRLQEELRETHAQLREANAKLAERSLTDSLTGLRNRRFFDERLPEEFRRAQRYGDHLSLIMVDLDHFKSVNDRHGHQVGDVVLREAGALIRDSIRDPDICSRYGGEEFAVILPKTHLSGALAVAERVWKALAGKEYVVRGPSGSPDRVHVTASLGVAFYPSREVTSAELLVATADRALYDAKAKGRNRVVVVQGQPYVYEAART